MKKAIVIYGSTGGNTAYLSKYVKSGLDTAGFETVVKDVRTCSLEELPEYDLVVIGSSTWDKEKLQGQLQVDMRPFNESLERYDFNGQAVAVFGVGHYSYTFTANAATILETTVVNAHGRLVAPTFRVDDVVDLFSDQIEAWASQISL